MMAMMTVVTMVLFIMYDHDDEKGGVDGRYIIYLPNSVVLPVSPYLKVCSTGYGTAMALRESR